MNKIWVLYSTEMWEKFNFYGMRSIFSLFLIYYLGFSHQESALYYGAYLALCYITPILGGIIGDNFLGRRKSIIIGCSLFVLAQFILFTAACMQNLQLAKIITISSLVLIAFANGFFKPNIVSSLTECVKDKSLMDSIFCKYYFFLNLGVFLGQIIVPILADKKTGDVRDILAFKWGFLATFIAMLIGLIIYVLNSKNITENIEKKEINIDKSNAIKAFGFFIVAFCFFVFISKADNFIQSYLYPIVYSIGFGVASYIFMDKSLTKQEFKDIVCIVFCAIFITFFWASIEQAGTSLTFIADSQTNRNLFGYDMPAAMIQVFNSIFVLIASWASAIIWKRLALQKKEPNNFTKQAIGMLIMALSFLILALIFQNLNGELLAIKWLILLYFMQSLAEILISPIGFALVGKKAPAKSRGMLYGLFYISNAVGYALSGSLASLMPPTNKDFLDAKNLGINLEEVLKGDATKEILQKLEDAKIPTSYHSFFGFEITNLYEFLMMFFVICLACSIIIFIISKIFKFEK